MKKIRLNHFILVVIALLLVNCTRSKVVSETDYDQLYALWYDNDYKDSLAQALKPSVERALALRNTADNRLSIDSVLNKLRWTRDSISFIKLSDKAVTYAKAKSDDQMLARAYNNIGMYYHDLSVLDSTFYYYIKAENVYKEIGDSMKIGEMEFYQARLLFEKGLHMESEVKVSNALNILKKNSLNPIPFEANQLMALCLVERKDYENAKVYLLRALELMLKDYKKNKILDKDKLQMAISVVYINLSDAVFAMKDYKAASEYAKLAETYLLETTPSIVQGVARSCVAKADFMLELSQQKTANQGKYIDEIVTTFNEAMRINNYYIVNNMAMIVADLYFQIGDLAKAFDWAEKAYHIAQSRDMKPLQREALEFLVTHKKYENNEQVKEIISLTHILEEQDYLTRNRFARIAYETEQIETENSKLKNMISVVVISSLSVVLALMVGVYIFRLRSKNREIRFIKGQHEANESIYQLILERSNIATDVRNNVRNRIAKDIHDGVVNGIFTIRFNLQQLQTDNDSLKDTLIKELQSLEKSTRDISHSLIDNELFDQKKFFSLLEDLLALQNNQWDTKFILKQDKIEDLEQLSALDKVNTYFIIREAIHNVNKYSEASLCVLSLEKEKEGVVVKIKDNGIGFDKNLKGDGMGILNMKERARALRSQLVIFSEKGMGTEIMFKIKTNHK